MIASNRIAKYQIIHVLQQSKNRFIHTRTTQFIHEFFFLNSFVYFTEICFVNLKLFIIFLLGKANLGIIKKQMHKIHTQCNREKSFQPKVRRKKLFWVFSGFLIPFMHNEYKQYCGLSCEAVWSRIDIPYTRYYKPRLVYFLPHFQRLFLCF